MTHSTTPATTHATGADTAGDADTRATDTGSAGLAAVPFGPDGGAPEWDDHWPGWDDDPEPRPAHPADLDADADDDGDGGDDGGDEPVGDLGDLDDDLDEAPRRLAYGAVDTDDEPTVEELLADDDLVDGLADSLDTLRATESADGVTVTVDLHGKLVDLRFDHAAMRLAAPELAARVRDLAATAAATALTAGLAALRGSVPPAVLAELEAQVGPQIEARLAAVAAPEPAGPGSRPDGPASRR